MAQDIYKLLVEQLRIEGPVVLVGHDIGLMIAYAHAQAHRDQVSHLVAVDAPLPGTSAFDRLRNDPRVWHFAFHGARDVAEMLVAGHRPGSCCWVTGELPGNCLVRQPYASQSSV